MTESGAPRAVKPGGERPGAASSFSHLRRKDAEHDESLGKSPNER